MAYVAARVPKPLAGSFAWVGWVRKANGDHVPAAWSANGSEQHNNQHALGERVRADHFKTQRTRADWDVKNDPGAEYAAESAADKLRKEEAEYVE